jgi:translation initiation factor IF-3
VHLAIESSSNNKQPRTRINRQIRISPVRVIADDGQQLGVLSIDEALAAALERGLDLVEVAPLARPPVVKIMDYGKFKFEQAKAARGSTSTILRSRRGTRASFCRTATRSR